MKNIFRVLGFVAAGMLGCAMSSSQLYAQSTFVYVNNSVNGANSVSAFVVGTGGALTAVPGSPFLTGGTGSGVGYFASNAIAATVVGNFLFASDSVSNDIAAFSIGTSTGALTPVPGSPFAYGTEGESNPNGISLAVTPNGRFLFAGDSMSADIWAFSIASDGALTAVPGSPFASPTSPDGINVTRDGRYVAVALFDGLEVAMFSIGPSGALTAVPGSPFLTGGSASGTGYVEINCASNLLFASQFSEGFPSIAVETIAGGALNAIRGSPFTFAAGANSNVGVLSPNDNFLFVSNQNSDTISSLSVAAGGALAEVTGSPFANPGTGTPTLMGTNQAGTLLYVSNDGYSNHNTVNAFTISGAGGLTLVPGSPFDTGAAGKSSLTVFPPKTCSAVTSTPGPFAYVDQHQQQHRLGNQYSHLDSSQHHTRRLRPLGSRCLS
jgi:6-phosphogluconolactonase